MLWKIAGTLLLASLIAFMEVPNLLKNKLKKELWLFAVLLSIGLGLGISRSLNLEIPSPLNLINTIYKPFSDGIYKVLK